uniref:SWIM-type domain-containing protein n=1 Tax=Fagus sylvatica TaxID=28930 RepID=A0A2N9EMB2_FAGSY
MTITYQHPHIILNNIAQFIPVLITSDDDVNLIFYVHNAWPQLAVIELYIVVEPITQHDLTQPLITPSHEGQTLTEECGPSNQHHYVPSEQSHLDEQVIMNAQTLQVDHLDDEFIDRIVSESRHHLDVDDQYEDSDIEIAISGGGVDGQTAAADDDDDDDDDNNALGDDHGEEEHAMPSYRIMEAPSPAFIANTWDNIIVPSNDEVQCVSVWKRGMELSKGMLFNNKDELQFAIRAYSIDKNQSYKLSESSMVKWATYCSKCEWYLWALYWEITIYNGPHTCTSSTITNDGKMMNSKFIKRHIHHLVKIDPTAKLKLLTGEVKEIWGQDVSYFKMWDAKQKAIGNIYGDWDKSYKELPKFLLEVQDRNPGFQHCRPIISINGTHLYGRYEGKLLIAMAIEVNNEVYLLAFAVVESENGIFAVQTPVNAFSANRGNHIQVVNLFEKNCTCGKWQLYKIPCSHSIIACNSMSVDGPRLIPDLAQKRGRGRPKATRIRNEMDWTERQSGRPSCRICREEGHNRRRCPNANPTSTSGSGRGAN